VRVCRGLGGLRQLIKGGGRAVSRAGRSARGWCVQLRAGPDCGGPGAKSGRARPGPSRGGSFRGACSGVGFEGGAFKPAGSPPTGSRTGAGPPALQRAGHGASRGAFDTAVMGRRRGPGRGRQGPAGTPQGDCSTGCGLHPDWGACQDGRCRAAAGRCRAARGTALGRSGLQLGESMRAAAPQASSSQLLQTSSWLRTARGARAPAAPGALARPPAPSAAGPRSRLPLSSSSRAMPLRRADLCAGA
jgi:hypothetical protein